MAIRQIWKSQLTDQMVIQWLFCLRIAIQYFKTQTQTQMEPEVLRKHVRAKSYSTNT